MGRYLTLLLLTVVAVLAVWWWWGRRADPPPIGPDPLPREGQEVPQDGGTVPHRPLQPQPFRSAASKDPIERWKERAKAAEPRLRIAGVDRNEHQGLLAGGTYGLTAFPQNTAFPALSYQKRRHAVWQPPTAIQASMIVPQPSVALVDLGVTVMGTTPYFETPPPYAPPFANFTAGPDEWPSVFVPWRYNVATGFFQPNPQNVQSDVFTPVASLGVIAAQGFKATSAPPPSFRINTPAASAPTLFSEFYYPGQSPLWAGWPPPTPSAFGIPPRVHDILRTHLNPASALTMGPSPVPPPTGNFAWVGIGGNTSVALSLTTFNAATAPSYAPYNIGLPVVVACHVDGVDPTPNQASGVPAGITPTPLALAWTPEVNILWYATDLSSGGSIGYEMLCINQGLPPAAGEPQWVLPVQSGPNQADVPCTEISTL